MVEQAILSALINGKKWKASTANRAHTPVTSAFYDGKVQIEGFINKANGDSETLVILVQNNFSGEGIYDNNVLGLYITDSDPYLQFSNSTEGEVIITFASYDLSTGKASGTFSGTLYKDKTSKIITDGVFTNLRIDQI